MTEANQMPMKILKWVVRFVFVGFAAWSFLRGALDLEGWARLYILFLMVPALIFVYWWTEILLQVLRRNPVAILMVLFVFSLFASSVYDAWHPDNRFIAAAEKGKVQAVRRYIEKGGDVNTVGTYHVPSMFSKLGYVIPDRHGREEWLRISVNPGITALHNAAGNGRQEVVKLLIEAGANPNARTKEGATPLHWATGRGIETVSLLIESGADVNAADNKGATPLHRTANPILGDKEAMIREAKLLIDNGADVNARMTDGQPKTPLTLALEWNHAEIANLLRRYGAVE